jgi:hypothetical protein
MAFIFLTMQFVVSVLILDFLELVCKRIIGTALKDPGHLIT